MSPRLPIEARTALAMSPTPDCTGRKPGGIRPVASSRARKSVTLRPICSTVSSGSSNALPGSAEFVSTTPAILAGSTLMTGAPMRSETR